MMPLNALPHPCQYDTYHSNTAVTIATHTLTQQSADKAQYFGSVR